MDEILKKIEEFERKQTRDWLSFARGIIPGLTRTFPKKPEPTLKEFKEWLLEEKEKKKK